MSQGLGAPEPSARTGPAHNACEPPPRPYRNARQPEQQGGPSLPVDEGGVQSGVGAGGEAHVRAQAQLPAAVLRGKIKCWHRWPRVSRPPRKDAAGPASASWQPARMFSSVRRSLRREDRPNLSPPGRPLRRWPCRQSGPGSAGARARSPTAAAAAAAAGSRARPLGPRQRCWP